MRYLSALVLLLPLVAALPSSPIEARGGKRCSTSPQCGNASLYCKRGTCSPRRELNGPCYKDIGCQSSRCVNKRCVKAEAPTTPALLALGAKCATSVSCASGYCGKARCAVPLPVGSDCYKAAGCLSGVCTSGKCAAPPTTPTTPTTPTEPPTTPGRDPVAVPGNLVTNPSFEDGTLGSFTATGAVKVVKGGAYDGLYSVQLLPLPNAPASIAQSLSGTKKRAITNIYTASFSYLIKDVVHPVGQQPCRIEARINGQAYTAAEPLFVPDEPAADWQQHTFTVQAEEVIQSVAIATVCNRDARATVQLDAISYLKVASSTSNVNNVGNLLLNPDFKEAGKFWTIDGDVTFSDVGEPIYTVNQDGDKTYALFKASTPATATSPSSASLTQTFNVFVESSARPDAPYGANGGFQQHVDAFTSTVTDAACKITYTLNGQLLTTIPITQVDGPSYDGQDYFREHNTDPSLRITPPGTAWPAVLKLSCDPGASATVRLDHTSVFAGAD